MKQNWPPSTQLSPIPATLITCADKNGENSNFLTVAWVGILSSQPPMCYVSIRPERHSYQLIKESMQFAINLTTTDMVKGTDLAGVISGRNKDKWKETGFTPCSSHIINCPLIEESPLSMECEVKQILSLGSHDVFIGEIVNVAVDEKYIDPESGKLDLKKADLAFYSHGEYFSAGEYLGHFGFSVKKKNKSQKR